MIHYLVLNTVTANRKIRDYAENLFDRSLSIKVVDRWANQLQEKLHSLETFPSRHGLAEENEFRDYEIQQIIISKYVALYYVDEEAKKVHVLTIRHGSQLPTIDELPEMPPE